MFNGTVVTVDDFKVERAEAGTEPSVLISARTEDGRAVSFRHDEIRDWYGNIRLDHGYALTITSAQGLTVDRTFLLADARPARETIYPAATRHREGLDIYVNRAPLALDIADRRADNDREVAVTDTEIRAWLAERWSRSQPKEAALDYMADGIWQDRRENVREAKSRSSGETQGETGKVRAAANDNALARIARDIRRTAFGWRHAQAVTSFVNGRREVLAAYEDLRERTRTEGDPVALGGAFRETLTRHAVLLKQAAAFRARPDDFAPLLAERGGIGRKDLHAFEELHARARRHRRAATMRLVHRIKKEAEQQRLKPEMRQGAQPIQDGVVEAAATIPAERIQPAGPDDGRLHTPAQAAPPIETVAMPIERDLAGDPPAVAPAPPVKKPPIPTKEDIAWDAYSALRQDWSRHLAAADRAGIHAIYVGGYEQLRARMETLAGNPALEDRPRRSLGNVLAQLDEGTEIRREIEDYLAAVKDRLEYRKQVLETVAIDLNKPVTGLTGYDRWRADIDRLVETGRRVMDDHDTYASHLNGIPLGLEHMRWALTDIGRLIGRDGRYRRTLNGSAKASNPHCRRRTRNANAGRKGTPESERERKSKQSALQETHEERQRRAQRDAREFSRLQSAAYNATGQERKAAQKEFDDYVERHSKKRETAEEEERQTHKRSRGRSMGM